MIDSRSLYRLRLSGMFLVWIMTIVIIASRM
jgi:hypothetical protein